MDKAICRRALIILYPAFVFSVLFFSATYFFSMWTPAIDSIEALESIKNPIAESALFDLNWTE